MVLEPLNIDQILSLEALEPEPEPYFDDIELYEARLMLSLLEGAVSEALELEARELWMLELWCARQTHPWAPPEVVALDRLQRVVGS